MLNVQTQKLNAIYFLSFHKINKKVCYNSIVKMIKSNLFLKNCKYIQNLRQKKDKEIISKKNNKFLNRTLLWIKVNLTAIMSVMLNLVQCIYKAKLFHLK